MKDNKTLIEEETKTQQETLKEIYDKYNSQVSCDEAYKYISAYTSKIYKIASGVACFILSLVFVMMSDVFYSDLLESIFICFFFAMIVFGVLIIVNANKAYKEAYRDMPLLSSATIDYLKEEFEVHKKENHKIKTIGILSCAFSFFPIIILNSIYSEDFGIILFFIMIAAGVFLIICSNGKTKAYKNILDNNS